MKKLAILALIAGMLALGSEALFASAFGAKIIYNKMMDEYSDREFENNLSGGIFFEVGPSFFGSRFRPGLDWVTLETDDAKYARVYGIHLDWFWFFMKGHSLTPFIGFGPSLNYFNFKGDQTNDDSDAGIEGFGGFEYNFAGPWSFYFELRLAQHDIADWDQRIFKASTGVVYYF